MKQIIEHTAEKGSICTLNSLNAINTTVGEHFSQISHLH